MAAAIALSTAQFLEVQLVYNASTTHDKTPIYGNGLAINYNPKIEGTINAQKGDTLEFKVNSSLAGNLNTNNFHNHMSIEKIGG